MRQLPQDIVTALVYYGDYQSYLDPLGNPCQCVTCDCGQRAQEALASLETWLVADIIDPDIDPKEASGPDVVLLRAVLDFYATGAGYGSASAAYGEGGHLARYALRSMLYGGPDDESDLISVDMDQVQAAAQTMPWTRAESVLVD